MLAPVRIAMLTLMLTLPAQAQDQSVQRRLEIDSNLFCDTQHQVERFVTHFNGNGRDAEGAISTINEEVQSDACVIATAAYRRDAQVSVVRNEDMVFDVIRVVVEGVFTVNGFEHAIPTAFFMLSPRDVESSTIGQGP